MRSPLHGRTFRPSLIPTLLVLPMLALLLWLAVLQLLEVHGELVAFDRLAAGSGGFFSPGGSWVFHARRSRNPGELGVSVVADVVVAAGLDGLSTTPYRRTPAFRHFHG